MPDDHPSRDMISINLSKANDQPDYTVRAIDFYTPSINHRSHPRGDTRISHVFTDELASYILQRLERIGPAPTIEGYPEDVVQLDGATLGRTRIMANLREGGGLHVILRFAHCIGDLAALFAFDAQLGRSPISDGEAAMLRAIEAVHLPVINMADECVSRVLQDEQRRAIEDRLTRVSQEIEELRFYFHLLARHIANKDAMPNLQYAQQPMAVGQPPRAAMHEAARPYTFGRGGSGGS